MPKFSIIIPVYNVEDYIVDCLNSIRKQTYQDIQVIIINDGSTDNSYEIIQSYLKKYDLSYELYTKENEGVSRTRNIGSQYANGEYLYFLDSDDYLESTFFEKVYECVCQYPSDMIRISKKYFNHGEKGFYNIEHYKNVYQMKGEDYFRYFRKRHLSIESVWLYVINSQFWKINEFQFAVGKIYEDTGLLPYVIMCASSISTINDVYLCDRIRENSITSSIYAEKNIIEAEMYAFHYTYLINQIPSLFISPNSKKYYIQYISDALLGSYTKLSKKEKEKVAITKKEIIDILHRYPIINYRGIIKKLYYISKIR